MSGHVMIEWDSGSGPTQKTSIKTTPNTTLKWIGEEAHAKLKLPGSPDQYGLRLRASGGRQTSNNGLDPTLTVRFANIGVGTKLYLYIKSGGGGESSATGSNSSLARPCDIGRPPSFPSASSAISSPRAVVPKSVAPPSSSNVQLVHVALQNAADASRLQGRFPSSYSLWRILKEFELSTGTNLTECTGLSYNAMNNPFMKALAGMTSTKVYQMPVILLLNREYNTIPFLASSTLADAGVRNGNVMMRLLFKSMDQGISHFASEIAAANATCAVVEDDVVVFPTKSASIAAPAIDSAVMEATGILAVRTAITNTADPMSSAPDHVFEKVDVSAPIAKPLVPVDEVRPSNQDRALEPSDSASAEVLAFDRDIRLLNPPDSAAMQSSNIILPDSFFTLTPQELKSAFQSMKSLSGQEKPLMTQKMREQAEALRKSRFPKTRIRIRFEDRYTLEASFLSHEPVSELYKVVRESMKQPEVNSPFILYTAPPYEEIGQDVVDFWTRKLSPASVVYFKSLAPTSKSSWAKDLLLPALMATAEDVPAPQNPVETIDLYESNTYNECQVVYAEPASDVIKATRQQSDLSLGMSGVSSSTSKPSRSGGIVPKWFKLNKG